MGISQLVAGVPLQPGIMWLNAMLHQQSLLRISTKVTDASLRLVRYFGSDHVVLVSFAVSSMFVALGHGDPEFTGFYSQVHQVHGIPGCIFNIITIKHTQINAKFDLLVEGDSLSAGEMQNIRDEATTYEHSSSTFTKHSIQFQLLVADHNCMVARWNLSAFNCLAIQITNNQYCDSIPNRTWSFRSRNRAHPAGQQDD